MKLEWEQSFCIFFISFFFLSLSFLSQSFFLSFLPSFLRFFVLSFMILSNKTFLALIINCKVLLGVPIGSLSYLRANVIAMMRLPWFGQFYNSHYRGEKHFNPFTTKSAKFKTEKKMLNAILQQPPCTA